MSLEGTFWTRKSDNAYFAIIADPEAVSGRSNRSLLAENRETGRCHWVTPEGLDRKYRKVTTQ